MHKLTCDVCRLMTLLNELYLNGQRALTLFAPYSRDPIFSIHLMEGLQSGAQVRLLYNFRKYQKMIKSLKSGFAQNELPDFGAIQALLLQSGIVKYPNFDLVLRKLNELAQRDFKKGERPVFIGLDTNLLRDLFYSANYEILASIPDNKIGFCISPNVKDELSFDRRKYRNDDLATLAGFSGNSQFSDIQRDFFNQPCLDDRLCRLGFAEMEKVKQIHWTELLPELDPREYEDSPDLNIIKTFKLAADERNADIFLLSRDDAFIAHAEAIPGLLTFSVQTPKFNREVFPVSEWGSICRLLYLAAVVFGAIRVQGKSDDFYLQGIWKGKKGEDWSCERLQLIPASQTSAVLKMCRKAWAVLDKMEWRPGL